MGSFATPPLRGPGQGVQSSRPDHRETVMGNEAATAKKSMSNTPSPTSLPPLSVCASTTSLGKRKADLKDESAGNSSIQQSPARKKKRALLYHSLSQTAEINPTPLSTPSKQSNGRPVEASPGNSSPQCRFAATSTLEAKVAVVIPKTVSKSTSISIAPPPIVCGHSIHPAYKDIYAKAMCPMCLAEACMNGLQSMQDRIYNLGGLVEWQKIQTEYHCKAYEWMPNSGIEKKKRRAPYTDATGTNVSYRHRKRQLVHLITELEALSEMETAWEAKQLPENSDIYNEQVRLRKQYSTTAALHWYEDTMDNGFLGRIEDDCNYKCRKVGRHWEVAFEADFPDSENTGDGPIEEKKRKALERHTKNFKWETLTKDQRKYIEGSKISKVRKKDKKRKTKKSDDASLQPTRKRRREDASVSFNEDVYVRTDADVDVLRKAASSLSEEFLEEPASKKPRTGILRTTRLERPEEYNTTIPFDSDSKPKRPHHVIPLNGKDGPMRDVTKSRMRRKRRDYYRGQWAVPQGSELVDTSGCSRDFRHREAIVEGLRKEAARMDDEDLVERCGKRSDNDAEMDDARVGRREATPQPSLPSLGPWSAGGRLLRRFSCHWYLGGFGTRTP
ncbi:hypothetical protein ACET3X_006836 [Alternaria dauci]|uniref:Uncharacterized protein n=1 Tax=Alternaria dauci TaxID=48095 RepID=A0ABR3UG81_9PLEO